jgi:hypothetical protein
MQRSSYFYCGLFLITGTTLMLQVLQTRFLSVVAWYYLVFFAISIAMFGLTAGAVWVYVCGDRFSGATLSSDLSVLSAAFGISCAASGLMQTTIAPITEPSLSGALVWGHLALWISLPFFFSGSAVSLALTRSPFRIARVYAVDMAGAALGSLGVLLLLSFSDPVSGMVLVGGVNAFAASLFAAARIGDANDVARLESRTKKFAALGIVLIAAGAANTVVQGVRPFHVKGRVEIKDDKPIFEAWNSFSRVAVFPTQSGEPSLWGGSHNFPAGRWKIDQNWINIDGDAATFGYRIRGDLEQAGFLRYDVSTLAYRLPGLDRAAVIGVGAGRDLLTARLFGVPQVVGVELNPILVELLTTRREYADAYGLNAIAGIRIETDEGRSWMARSEERFDLIQMSLVDTWAATGAGAFTLSENGLYTLEAWSLFLSRLQNYGVFTVSRWYAPELPAETGRLLSLAAAAVLADGASDPRQHIFLAAIGNIATLVLTRSPLSNTQLEALEMGVEELDAAVLAAPGHPPSVDIMNRLLNCRSLEQLRQVSAEFALDMTPPTDERPFFFNQLPLGRPLRALELAWKGSPVGVASGNLRATGVLILLFLVSLTLVLGAIVIPLRSAVRDAGRGVIWSGTAYFLLIGVGFMLIEMGLLQRMSVFLGHPVYSLSITLFSIVLWTGAGSYLSDLFPLRDGRMVCVWAAAVALYVVTLPLWLPAALQQLAHAHLLIRAAFCVATIAPAGVLLGFGFPTGMRIVSEIDPRPMPWLWGINGAAGVLASSMAVGLSLAWGISTTLMIGGLCYLVLIPAALHLLRLRSAARPLS